MFLDCDTDVGSDEVMFFVAIRQLTGVAFRILSELVLH
jgi:hypothetical protein